MAKYFRQIENSRNFIRETPDFPPHIHDDIEIVYCKSGHCFCYRNSEKYELKQGEFFVAFPNQMHYYTDGKSGEYYIIITHPNRLVKNRSVADLKMPECPKGKLSNPYEFETLFNFSLEAGEDASLYTTLIWNIILKNLGNLRDRKTNDTLSEILDYCSSHYKEHITVDAVADALHISRSHVSHLFSNKLKIKFCEYINSLRIYDATRLLETDIPITEIADMVGFSTIRTFNRAFLSGFGISPSEYRKREIMSDII